MTDAEFVFNRTAAERKSAAMGSYHKKRGAKSKKCTLPSDYLSKKEKKGLNGKVMTYKFRGLTWEEFKSYPIDIRRDIIKNYIQHGARLVDAANYLGTNGKNFSAYLKNNDISRDFSRGLTTSAVWLDYITNPAEDTREEPESTVDAIDDKKAKRAKDMKAQGYSESKIANYLGMTEDEVKTMLGEIDILNEKAPEDEAGGDAANNGVDILYSEALEGLHDYCGKAADGVIDEPEEKPEPAIDICRKPQFALNSGSLQLNGSGNEIAEFMRTMFGDSEQRYAFSINFGPCREEEKSRIFTDYSKL